MFEIGLILLPNEAVRKSRARAPGFLRGAGAALSTLSPRLGLGILVL
jgi:hypothetical protein